MLNLIYALPDEPTLPLDPSLKPVMSLQEAIDQSAPGTEIRLLPGRYFEKIVVRRKRGADGKPIVIQGAVHDTIIDGLVNPLCPSMNRKQAWCTRKHAGRDLRGMRDNAVPMFRLENCSWIEFRDLSVVGCWPHFLHIRSCDHLTVAGCQIVGGKDAIFVDDATSKRPSHHILIEHNAWCQDPSGPADALSDDPSERRLWQEWVWHQFKKPPDKKPWAGDPRWEDLRFMNGGFVVAEHMAGSLIVRHNQMRFAFNAVMLMTYENQTQRRALDPADLGDAPPEFADPKQFLFNYDPPDPTRNTNIEIYDNTIEYIRDNAVEPEYGATNLWVWNNRIRNVHKAWSIHNNGGGFWYFFGNTGAHDQVPPAQVNEPPEWRRGKLTPRKLGGSLFKLLYGPPLPDKPCFVFHNSWRPRGSVMNDGEMRHFTHVNNAIEHCAPALPADLLCGEARFARAFREGDPFNYGFVTRIPPVSDAAANRFDTDVSSGVDFPEEPQDQGQEQAGIKATCVFDPARRAEFALDADSPARGAATFLALRAHLDWAADEDWSSDAPDAGAIQSDGAFRGPIFAHLPNQHYDEAPRLVGLEPQTAGLVLVFSVPVNDFVPNGVAGITLHSGERVSVHELKVRGRRVFLSLPAPVDPNTVASVELPHGFTGGADAASLPMTSWASIIPLTLLSDLGA